MGLFSRRPSADREPPDVSTRVAAGAAARGEMTGSGEVAPWNQLQPYYGPGLTPMGPHVLQQGDPTLTDLPPASVYQDRPLHGGVQTLAAFGEFVRRPAFAGGFVVMANRPPLALIEGQQMSAQSYEADASWREAPPVVDLCRRIPSEVGGNG